MKKLLSYFRSKKESSNRMDILQDAKIKKAARESIKDQQELSRKAAKLRTQATGR